MSVEGGGVMAEGQVLFDKNLAFFAEKVPELYPGLSGFRPQTSLVLHDNGESDVEVDGRPFYGMSTRTFAERQLASPDWLHSRIQLAPPTPEGLDEYGANFLNKFLHRAREEEGFDFHDRPSRPEAAHAVVFGIGLAAHLEQFAEVTKCRHLILVDSTVEFLFQSMHLFNWDAFITRLEAEDRIVRFLINQDPEVLSRYILGSIRYVNPCGLDGCYLFFHYRNPVIDAAEKALIRDAVLVLSGLGFFRDDLTMVKNSFFNLQSGTARTISVSKTDKTVPAFVVGAGPSLDDSLDFLKSNRNKGVVIACGTALRPLLSAGIRPDFLCILENTPTQHLILEEIHKEFGLDDIVLVASTTIDPRVRGLFTETVFFFRSMLVSFEIFGNMDAALHRAGPTVTNTGLAFAQETGFKRIIFVGTDMGVRNPEIHHAKASDYDDNGAVKEWRTYNMPIPGNFGGTVLTSPDLFWARDEIKHAMAAVSEGREYWNLSDGALLPGAEPIRLDACDLGDSTNDPRITQEAIINSTSIYDRDHFAAAWSAANLKDDLSRLFNEVSEILETNRSPDERLEALARRFRLPLSPEEESPGAATYLCRGTAVMAISAASYYLSRLKEPEKHGDLFSVFIAEFVGLLDRMRTKGLEMIEELEA